MTRLRRSISIACVLLTCASCATNGHVVDEYHEAVKSPTSRRTVVLFLVDGMALSTLDAQLRRGRLPHMQKYFLGASGRYYLARTTFPSLTYPAIASLLTESPTDVNGIYGNVIEKDGRVLNFENPSDLKRVNRMISGKNVFSRLRSKGMKTVSLDYVFNADTDAHLKSTDVKIGYAILDKNYRYVDDQILTSLKRLLVETAPSMWPDFVFVHLIGVDFLSHDHGPQSAQVLKYLETLDKKLEQVFSELQSAERSGQRQVVSLMTSDHGFDDTVAWTLDLESALKKYSDEIKIFNEGRFIGLKFGPSKSLMPTVAKSLAELPGIELIAQKSQDQITITYSSVSADRYPYFLSNLTSYFQTGEHPDLIVLPKSGISFKRGLVGQHGGPTSKEVFVPLLMRNGSLTNSQSIPALWELLSFL